MNFANVNQMRIPEGDVQRITANGVALWEMPSADGLPAGYEACEYIQFSGKQQFDTGIIPTEKTKIELTFTRESSNSLYMYGVRNSGNTASVTAYLATSGAWRYGNTYRNYTLSQNTKHTAIVDSTGVNMDGTKSSYGATVKAFTANATLTFGATRGTGGALGTPQFIGKLYTFKMYDNGELIRDYMPCINPQGVYGFWENVQRVFVSSATTTAFTGG
jgi:hypothetical protein